ncbi:MAG: PDZ domain-containing protein [Gemmatimonas sp.]|jgi:serine protease Do|uniref:PDZ domain-containing protein n=1 Tax=Gemmatimonas sp. TaxID=1962908 RepID=UPI00391EF390|nr:PDZ domain-containing protein [Gemmatimonadota bacterium]
MPRFRLAVATLSLAAVPCVSAPLTAQPRETRVLRLPSAGGAFSWTTAADRAVLGVTLGAGSTADTAGVLLEAVEAEGPAAKAGVKAGDRLTAINGVSLKVARADAEDLALTGLAQRRLQRVLAKAKPGDEVTLQVRSGTASRSVAIKTVSAADLQRVEERRVTTRERRAESASDSRGMVGLSIGAAGNARDTLGLFVSSVVTGGPAEKAGIIEGERIAAVNGVDVRIPREDVEDAQSASARADRFVREVQKMAPGQTVSLRVYGNGRYRDVSVTAVRASDLPSSDFGVSIGDREIRIMTPSGPRPPRATWTPAPPGEGEVRIIRPDGRVLEFDGVRMRESLDELRQRLREDVRGLEGDLRNGAPVRMSLRRTISAL